MHLIKIEPAYPSSSQLQLDLKFINNKSEIKIFKSV